MSNFIPNLCVTSLLICKEVDLVGATNELLPHRFWHNVRHEF